MFIGELFLWQTRAFNWILNQVMALSKANTQTCEPCYQKQLSKEGMTKAYRGNSNIVY